MPRLVRFGVYEADLATGELRKRGIRLKLQDQPFRVLALLLERPGELVTREEMQQKLWPADTFVDFDHGLNACINKLREALNDSAASPRYIETLPRRGYRFLAAVEAAAAGSPVSAAPNGLDAASELSAPRGTARVLFLLTQVMYLCFYVAVLMKLRAVQTLLEGFMGGAGTWALGALVVTAMVGVPLRFFLFNAVAFDYRPIGEKFLKLFPAVCLMDWIWALSPLLLAQRIGLGLPLAIVAALLYLPFGERTLVRMAYRK